MCSGVCPRASPGSGTKPLPPALARRIERQLKLECADIEAFAKYSPELQIASLSVMAARRDGLDPANAIDLVLAVLAREFGKPVASLETPELQVQALQMPSQSETIAFVSSALDDLESGRTRPMLNRMAKVWTEGNYAELSRFESWCNCVDTAAERAAMKRMLDDRNPQLAEAIDSLHGSGTVFAAVGSLHMIGPKGLRRCCASAATGSSRAISRAEAGVTRHVRRAIASLALALASTGAHAMDVSPYWNFDDPPRPRRPSARPWSIGERRRRPRPADPDRSHLRPALALRRGSRPARRGRAAARRRRCRAAGALAARTRPHLPLRQAAERARPLFVEAAERAQAAKLEALEVDALHMVALVETAPEAQLQWNRKALAVAAASADPQARNWDASLANNIGMTLHHAGRYEEALASFRTALAARERIGNAARIRVAHWMIAWTLRSLGRHDEALTILRRLEAEYAAGGTPDGYVFEEIGENLLAQQQGEAAKPYFARAWRTLSADTSPDRPDEAHLARLERLSR
jgi:tetratricopeptide (TPR) repeat protein